ncbi:hypothetical protein BD309DRAFT_339469 [Dichomitus squalens]|uniref:Uncharacterized protein n=1 Tax=Dichomitus squalens TaxID=114155 RepID=A0A4Q9Q1S8_9APHY|nr:hypothetical protein BD309DRAFT_339469 [Dichomitus squalens]TBU60534.1 hypothetical protein BD310DRAFT_321056 [Dichomitus squalens]
MSTKYDVVARPAKQVYPGPFDPTLLHMDRQNASYRPVQSNQSFPRRAPADLSTQSLPQSGWLSDVAAFTASPPSQGQRPVGSVPGSAPITSPASLSDSGHMSPRTVHRARSRDHLLSASPNPPAVFSSGSPSPRPSPSPVLSPSRTLHTSRSFSTVTSHKTLALSSDASGHLDLKRLMSKPAKQASSGSPSLVSDSERSTGDPSSSQVSFPHRPSEGAIPRPPLSRSAHASREKMSLHVNTTGLRSSSVPRRGSSSSPGDDSLAGKSTRNALRRRPSARSNPTTPATHHSRSATDDLTRPVGTPTVQRVPYQLHAHRDSGAPFAAYMSPSRPSTSPSGLPPRPVTSPLVKGSNSPSRSESPRGLTPAGAVALAYKQQEQRREELAETASFSDAYRPSSATPLKSVSSPRSGYDSANDEATSGGPYYTVFGGASGRLVAVGSPQDDDWYHGVHETRATVSLNGKHVPSGSRSLSRKVSGSFKRVTGSIKRGDRDHPELPVPSPEDWKPYDGSQGRSHTHTPSKVMRNPTLLNPAMNGKHSPSDSSATKSSPSPKEFGRPAQSSKLKGDEHEEDRTPGSKWWKLMKRLSTGGLREKYQHPDTLPPPVPALPQNLLLPSPSRTTLDITGRGPNGEEVTEEGVLLRKFMQSRRSLSGVRPNPSPPKTPPSTGSSRPGAGNTNTTGRPSTGNTTKSRASTSGHRPSTATRSSSPGSSEMASSSLFNHNRTPSTRSSFSSYGEEIPPLPSSVGQYIVSPSELSRMTKSSEHTSSPLTPSQLKGRTRTQSRSHTAPPEDGASPEERHLPSLPLPPRRVTTGSAISPTAHSFNVEDTIDKLMPSITSVPPPLGEFGMNEPPPRPKRSSRRAPPQLNVEVHARSQSASATMPLSPQTPRAPPQVRVDVDLIRRPSVGALSHRSTPKPNSATSSSSPSSNSPSSAVSQKRSPLTFRELESPRHKLTEKEKAAKWEDLLERSARAGGTLHLGESRLMSEEPDMLGDDRSVFDADD